MFYTVINNTASCAILFLSCLAVSLQVFKFQLHLFT